MPEISTGHHRKALDKRRKIENNALVIVAPMVDSEAPGFCSKALTGHRRCNVGEQRPGAFARSGVALMVIAADFGNRIRLVLGPGDVVPAQSPSKHLALNRFCGVRVCLWLF